jgi:hypothetical protein
MNLTGNQTTALFQLYPSVTVIQSDVAYDAEGNIVNYDLAAVDEQAAKIACKSQATTILTATDWTSIADVGNAEMSNPYLVNQAEFIAYRSTVRGYAVNPVVDPVWPTPPTEQWSN